jgi:hypothetical protein
VICVTLGWGPQRNRPGSLSMFANISEGPAASVSLAGA